MTDVLIRRGNLDRDSEGRGREEIHGEDGHLQAKERGLGRNQPCSHLCLRLLASRIVRKLVSLLQPAACGALLWQPKQTNALPKKNVTEPQFKPLQPDFGVSALNPPMCHTKLVCCGVHIPSLPPMTLRVNSADGLEC